MPDLEKAIQALKICASREPGKYTCDKCPYETRVDGDGCEVNLMLDAMDLLKEQEALKQPEVIRCKDCVNNGTSRCPCHYSGDPYIDWNPDDDWFCADGTR